MMVSNPYRMHAAVAGSFPPQAADGETDGRVLWRIDRLRGGGMLLYIASPQKPSLIGLNEQIGWPDIEPQWQTRSYDGLLDRLREGQQWAFRLVANPVVNRVGVKNQNGEGRTKRIEHLTLLQQAAWLIGKQAYVGTDKPVPELFLRQEGSRAERNGFKVLDDPATGIARMTVSDSRRMSFGPGKQRCITLITARYDGLLEVTDVDALRHALKNGIGHGKGFGCGLLTLAPVDAS